jgi:hypothetical protein
MAVILVEHRFRPALDMSRGTPGAHKLVSCLPSYDVTWLSSYFATDGARGICVYEARDAETVRRAYRAAGVGFVAVWSSLPAHRVDRGAGDGANDGNGEPGWP